LLDAEAARERFAARRGEEHQTGFNADDSSR
jgi:hypothetical protein